jgi:hypothetical protein
VSELGDAERARKLFDWVIDHIVLVAVMVFLQWIVMATMCFGIIANTRNGSDAARRTSQIIQQNAKESAERSERSTEDRRILQEAIQCVIDQFAEHRITNQAVHDGIAKAMGVAPTPHTPLPERATEEQIMKVCAPFSNHK